jgi:16S rRNA (cytosine967-C5)-methyltransferase
MKPDKGRITAFNVLKRVLILGGYSNISLDEEIKKNNLLPEDKKLAAKICYGVLERKTTLEIILDRFVSRNPKPEIKIILLMGIYQALFLDNIPNHAVVSSSVELAKTFSKNKAQAGFVNAILHSVLREPKENLLSFAFETETGKYSISKEMLSIIKNSLGEKTDLFLNESFGRPPIYIKVNTLKTSTENLVETLKSENVEAEHIEGFENALKISGKLDIAKTESYKNGLFFVQDLSSQFAINALEIAPEDTIFDLCAAPGGKSFSASMYLKSGKIKSFDIYKHKVELIKKSALRLGIENLEAEVKNALDVSGRENSADKIICDVPCSGSGVLRRKPEIRYKNENLKDIYRLQFEILSAAAKMVRPGGKILYSTCSVSKKENEDIVKSFLMGNLEFKALKYYGIYDKIIRSSDFGTTILPEHFGGDGFFFCVLERKNK